jgi:hypothetical protein
MKAQELRIGNWIYNGGIKSQVSYILLDDINCTIPDIEGVLNGDITPIPLTEEWLLKLGFDKKTLSPGFHCSDFRHGNKLFRIYWPFILTPDRGSSIYLPSDTESDCYQAIINGIKYVHQLQNIYYALTGNELCLQ